jgi:hypothetical protein
MRSLLLVVFLCLIASVSHAEVVRPSADFSYQGVGPKASTLKGLRGQPVVLMITDSPKNGDFRKQLFNLKFRYQEFANKQVIFVAAFTKEPGPIKSNIPVVTANDGAAVAGAYGAQGKFTIAIIGKDGNLDYQTRKVLSAARVNDVIQNSYAVQSVTGR